MASISDTDPSHRVQKMHKAFQGYQITSPGGRLEGERAATEGNVEIFAEVLNGLQKAFQSNESARH